MHNSRHIVEDTLVPHTAYEEATRRLEQCFHYARGTQEPICFALFGESRTGKSRVLEECNFRHPSLRDAEGLVVPILRVTTPSKPTVKGLAELMLGAMEDPKFDKGTEIAKTRRLVKLMREARTRMVVIDEFQHFVDKGSLKVMHHVADWLKTLVDDCKVALVVAGLPTCSAVLEQNEQLRGRFLSPHVMPRFDWDKEADRIEFVGILESLHLSLRREFDMPDLMGPEMAFRCYCGSGGLVGYVTKFLRQMVWNAWDANTKTITLEDMLRAHEEAVWHDHGLQEFPSPFSKQFPIGQARDGLVEKVKSIGLAREPEPRPRGRNRRGNDDKPSLSSVFTK